MNYLQYILTASVCTGIFYTAYVILFKKGLRFTHARIFLSASIIISLLIPLSRYQIETGFQWPGKKDQVVVAENSYLPVIMQPAPEKSNVWDRLRNADPLTVVLWIYLCGSALLLLRLLITILLLAIRYHRSFKVRLPEYILLYNHGFRDTLSFFRWIFVRQDNTSEDDLSKIIAHEKIHVIQLHSADILIIELLTAVMWFNPFIWMIRNSMKLVHEYLADEGALRSGISISGYQALLINQIAEERLMVLSSSFNHSLIKKRITMMTRFKNTGKSPVKLLVIIPVAALLFMMMAAFNDVSGEESQTSTASADVFNNTSVLTPVTNFIPDTIRKKTVVKKVTRENPSDTVIIEKEVIIFGDDTGEKRIVHIINEDGHEKGNKDVISHADVMIVDPENVEVTHDGKIIHIDTVRHMSGKDMKSEHHKVVIRHNSGNESDILYIVDGEKMTDKDAISFINPDEIQSVSVIKGEDAAQYGKNYSGVLIITTKKPKK